MRHVTSLVLLSVALLGGAVSPASARTWTDRAGRQLEADFVAFADGKVEIKRKSDGKTFHVPLERFSDADQAFVRSQAKRGVPPDGSPEAWATDWPTFVKRLSVEVAKDNYFVGNVNAAFSGKKVEWTGKVTEINRPEKDGDSGLIRLSMKSEKLELQSGAPNLDSLVLTPDGDEWKTWTSISAGEEVRFRTTLDEGSLVPKCVLMKMDGMGPNAGKTIVWINTKGGSCLKTLATGNK
jgi:hypothetical protein